MNPLTAQIAMLLVFAAPGLLLLGWAIASRQFRGGNEANWAINSADDPTPAAPDRGANRRARWGLAAIIAVFLLLSVCPVGLTLFLVMTGGGPHKGSSKAAQPAARRHIARAGNNMP